MTELGNVRLEHRNETKWVRAVAVLAMLASAYPLWAQAPAAGEALTADPSGPGGQDYPFRDLAGGKRFPGQGRVTQMVELDPAPLVQTGQGRPCTLQWAPRPGAVATMLYYRQGEEVVRQDVTGQDSCQVVFRAPVRACMVESLHRRKAGGDQWLSRIQNLPVDVRGVFPFAGDVDQGGELRDAEGLSARFREAFDVVKVPVGSCGWVLVVTDPRAHVLRRSTLEGGVSTLCGVPDQAGHQDSPALGTRISSWFSGQSLPPPRFNRPTYLGVRASEGLAGGWEILVADSGNQVIRQVGLDGTVATLAGTIGRAGHADADNPREALFNDPRGLVVDFDGNTYVADHGNYVIRRIARNGQVTTLAGMPGRPGTGDGIQGSARFLDLKGLAWQAAGEDGGVLFALDGHAVRAVSLPEGVVATVLGRVDTPGWKDLVEEKDRQDPHQPCLADPVGLRCREGALYLADTGNHAIRKAYPGKGFLQTLVGGPDGAGTRWGLLRDGLPGPLGPGYAALASPTGVTGGPQGPSFALLVSTGSGLVLVRDRRGLRDHPWLTEVECTPGGRSVRVAFRPLTADGQGRSTVRPIAYTVDLLDPDGKLAERKEGQGRSSDLVAVQGTLTQAGKGSVLIRCVTDEGVAAGIQVPVKGAGCDKPQAVPGQSCLE